MRRFCYFLLVLCFVSSGLAQNAEPAQHSTHAAASQAKPSADKVWADLMDGNKRFVAGKPRAHDVVALRRKLASKQAPNVIILSCSDSRVSPELTFDQSVGDLFVVRTAGNVADPVALGSINTRSSTSIARCWW